MAVNVPYTKKPEDVSKLLNRLPKIEVPAGKVDAGYIQSLGFSVSSSKHLFNILKMLGFIDDRDKASAAWIAFAADEKRGLILASAMKKAYPYMFKEMLCPYLADDETLFDYFKMTEEASPEEIELIVLTFRYLAETADFQDVLCEEGPAEKAAPEKGPETEPRVKVNPNLQLNIQIHIDPNTPDEKIEAIFKNMRKYLVDQPG